MMSLSFIVIQPYLFIRLTQCITVIISSHISIAKNVLHYGLLLYCHFINIYLYYMHYLLTYSLLY